ncbi:tape measure protein [Gallibacterium anatis]|uniref:Uncharacterized protein n=1 Tax=Gallibacterium anatis TaxID=750 RepID=A0A0A2X9X7_9PAST|nr:tape measure protein [Gallibacterium anatis]KGQ29176.1 hypothetical protein JP32_11635 [Gallibacterium anatis]
MATNSTSFYINLAGNVALQARRFGQSIQSMTARSTRALSSLKSAVASVSNSIDTAGNRLFIGVTASGALAARSLIKTAADFEMAGIHMKQTFGADGDKATAWLKQFATDTPMAFGDVQDAMMRLKTAGVDPMNGSLQALVDYNAKVGGDAENLNGYISAISKGFIKGKLSMEEINPLLERNVKVFEILAAETGGKYTAEQMQKMLQEGKLGRKAIAALLRGMGKDAAGAAKEQMKTWYGLVSNLEDTFVAMQARFAEKGIFDELKGELGGILDWLNQKMDSGEFDAFAQQVNDTLVSALRDLKDTAKEFKPILEQIGSVMSWLSEKAGGYGNLAKFVAALYAANKVARWGSTQAIAKGAWGVGKWGVGRLLGKRGRGGSGASETVADALGAATGATPVYVVNMPNIGSFGGGHTRGQRRQKTSRKPRHQQPKLKTVAPKTVAQEIKNKAPTTKQKTQTATSKAQSAQPKTVAPVKSIAQNVKTSTQAIQKTATTAIKTTATATKTMTSTLTKGLRSAPTLGVGMALAEGAMVLANDNASTQEKSESIGAIAGATAGAIVGQALIPIPVVGAMVGSYVGDWLGSWLGSEVGKKLAEPAPQETKLDGAIEVKIKATEGLIATATNTTLKTNNNDNSLKLKTITGNTRLGLVGGD